MPTYTELKRGFEFGPWSVLPDRCLVRNGEEESRLEPKVMDVFVVLVSHDGEVVSRDQLIQEVWGGRPQTDDVINRCIRELRKALGDNARDPIYIQTVQKRGYRVMLHAVLPESVPDKLSDRPSAGRRYLLAAAGIAAVIVLAVTLWPPPVTPAPTSVAVFEFDCVQGPGASDAHLCFGFAEEIISTLQKVGGLLIVRKRMPYASSEPVDEDGVVSGSVQIIGDEVRIAAQLDDARTGKVLWSDSFDSSRRDIFDQQRLVAKSAAGYFDPALAASSASPQSSAEFAAKSAFERGRYLFRNRDHDSIRTAILSFRVAIEEDPSFAEAYLYLAYMYVLQPDYEFREAGRRWDIYDDAIRIMDEGVKRDPGIRDRAGTVYGFIYHKRNQWARALEETGRAVNAPTANADDYNWHSRVLASVGRLEEARDYARQGVEIDPDNFPVAVSRMAIASFWVDDLETAKYYFDQANSKEFDASVHYLAYSLFLLRTAAPVSDIKAYARAGLEALEGSDVDSSWLDPIVDGIVNEADRAQAIAIFDQVVSTGKVPFNMELTLWVLLGAIDRAMEIAQRTENPREAGGLFEQELIFIDQFKPFREHPEFMDFIAGVGLADYWQQAGCVWADDRLTCAD